MKHRLQEPGAGRSRVIVVLTLLVVAWGSLSAPLAAKTPILKAVVSKDAIRVGGTVTVAVRISRARGVSSVPFTIYFDPKILEFVEGSGIEGNFLRHDGAATRFLAAPGPASRGGGVVVGLSRLAPAGGIRGKGLLCKLKFRAVGPGTTPITFSRASALDPTASSLAVTFKGTSVRVRPSR